MRLPNPGRNVLSSSAGLPIFHVNCNKIYYTPFTTIKSISEGDPQNRYITPVAKQGGIVFTTFFEIFVQKIDF